MKILVINAGSSTLKSSLYQFPDQKLLWESTVDWMRSQIVVKSFNGAISKEIVSSSTQLETLSHLLSTIWQGDTAIVADPNEIEAIGHRVVHGGQKYSQPTRITQQVKDEIAQLSSLAPIHNPANLNGIEIAQKIFGEKVPQYAVFDTAFHSSLPDEASIYPGPYAWQEKGIRRYGFHGISHQYCADRSAQILNKNLDSLRLIICHLGNGCSLSAVRNACSIDTTMGFTPLDGLMMGTRCGSVDPGILLYLLQQENYTCEQLDQELNYQSGLKGISGISSDLREILSEIQKGNSRAKLALDIYIHRLRSCIGAMLASLGGLDALVFTAGVGENSPLVRSLACDGFKFLGLEINHQLNENKPFDQDISDVNSKIRVLVIHTQEDLAIAKSCYCLQSENLT